MCLKRWKKKQRLSRKMKPERIRQWDISKMFYLLVHGKDDHQLPEDGDKVKEEIHAVPRKGCTENELIKSNTDPTSMDFSNETLTRCNPCLPSLPSRL